MPNNYIYFNHFFNNNKKKQFQRITHNINLIMYLNPSHNQYWWSSSNNATIKNTPSFSEYQLILKLCLININLRSCSLQPIKKDFLVYFDVLFWYASCESECLFLLIYHKFLRCLCLLISFLIILSESFLFLEFTIDAHCLKALILFIKVHPLIFIEWASGIAYFELSNQHIDILKLNYW